MNIDWTKVAAGVVTVANLVKEIAPAAALAGPEGALAGGIISGAASFVSGVATQAELAGPVLASGDLATIQAALADIQAANNVLAQRTASS